jgi:hypothetical protein
MHSIRQGKGHPITGRENPEGEYSYSSTLSLTSALDAGGWSTPRPGRFTPGKDPVPIVQEAGWAPGPVRTGAENLAPTEIRSPDRPVNIPSTLPRPTLFICIYIQFYFRRHIVMLILRTNALYSP